MNESDPIAAFLANVGVDDPAATPEAFLVSDDPDTPRVVFKGTLELTRPQEERLCHAAQEWIQHLKNALGREKIDVQPENYGRSAKMADLGSFFGRRRLFELMFEKQMEWRKSIPRSIYQKSNLHLPFVRRIVQQMIARLINYFFQTSPWCSANPHGPADEAIAQMVNRFTQYKFREARVQQAFETAVSKACVRGESVVKCTAAHKSRWYQQWMTVAIDPQTQKPLFASDGDYIQQSDKVVAATDPETGEPITHPETGEPVMVLARDPNTQIPAEGLTYARGKYRRERVIYSGPKAEVVYYLDFLCPEDAVSVQEAPFCAHLYHLPAAQIAQSYVQHMQSVQSPEEAAQLPKMVDLLQDAASMRKEISDVAAPGARAEDGPKDGTLHPFEAPTTGFLGVAECYLTLDVDDDGQPEEVMLLINTETWEPIFYEYTDLVTMEGERPFYVVRVNPVENRWYGSSLVDLFWDLQIHIDLTWNRWNVSQSEAGRVTTFNPEHCYEGDANPHLVMNAGRTFRLKPGKTIEDLVGVKQLHDIKAADLQTIVEFCMQMGNGLSGVSNTNDADMAGLDTTKLATGIRNLEKSGQELFSPLLGHVEEGLNAASTQLLRIAAASMRAPEAYRYFEGSWSVETMTPEMLEGLKFTVEMELTRYKSEQQLQQGLAVLGVVDRFYAEDPSKQQLVAPLYIELLQLFGHDHPDRYIQPGFYFPPPGGGPDPATAEKAVKTLPPGKSDPNL